MIPLKKNKGEVLKEIMINGAKQHKPVSAIRSGLKLSISLKVSKLLVTRLLTQQRHPFKRWIKNVNGVYGSARGGARVFWSRGYDMSA
jgi:hypothetical protein